MSTTSKVGRKPLEPAVNVRMSQSCMPILIRYRQGMEIEEGRRISDREALDSLLKMTYNMNMSQGDSSQ